MQFQSTGGIFLRLDSSGNLNIYDTSGTTVVKIVGGLVSGKLNKGTAVNNAPISTWSTAGANKFLGRSIQITPAVSGSVLVVYNATISNDTAGSGFTFGLQRANGSVNPAGGAAAGDPIVDLTQASSDSANGLREMTGVFLQSGLTAGNAYTFEIYVSSPGVTNATIAGGVGLYAVEL